MEQGWEGMKMSGEEWEGGDAAGRPSVVMEAHGGAESLQRGKGI